MPRLAKRLFSYVYMIILSMAGYKKWLIVIICFICAVIGFIIKIPRPLRGNDKLLHAAFYFLAALFLNFLFKKRQVVIFIILALFGVMIEYLQQLSNKITNSQIHGRFDVQDIYANLKGLAAYAVLAILYFAITGTYKYLTRQEGGKI